MRGRPQRVTAADSRRDGGPTRPDAGFRDRSDPTRLLALQRTAGNRATAVAVASERRRPTDPVVQRDVRNHMEQAPGEYDVLVRWKSVNTPTGKRSLYVRATALRAEKGGIVCRPTTPLPGFAGPRLFADNDVHYPATAGESVPASGQWWRAFRKAGQGTTVADLSNTVGTSAAFVQQGVPFSDLGESSAKAVRGLTTIGTIGVGIGGVAQIISAITSATGIRQADAAKVVDLITNGLSGALNVTSAVLASVGVEGASSLTVASAATWAGAELLSFIGEISTLVAAAGSELTWQGYFRSNAHVFASMVARLLKIGALIAFAYHSANSAVGRAVVDTGISLTVGTAIGAVNGLVKLIRSMRAEVSTVDESADVENQRGADRDDELSGDAEIDQAVRQGLVLLVDDHQTVENDNNAVATENDNNAVENDNNAVATGAKDKEEA